MLELFGRGYVIEHCISALKSNSEDKAYKIYVTDALMAIAENTTRYLAMNGTVVDVGRTITKRWIDVITAPSEKPEEPEETEDDRPSEEIASDIWNRIRGH